MNTKEVKEESIIEQFAPETEGRDGFEIRRLKKNYVEITKDGVVVGRIKGDITQQVIESQLSRAKLRSQNK